jgi:hypothetical protein
MPWEYNIIFVLAIKGAHSYKLTVPFCLIVLILLKKLGENLILDIHGDVSLSL